MLDQATDQKLHPVDTFYHFFNNLHVPLPENCDEAGRVLKTMEKSMVKTQDRLDDDLQLIRYEVRFPTQLFVQNILKVFSDFCKSNVNWFKSLFHTQFMVYILNVKHDSEPLMYSFYSIVIKGSMSAIFWTFGHTDGFQGTSKKAAAMTLN